MTRIISNFKRLGEAIRPEESRVHEYVGDGSSTVEFLRKCLRADVVILNIDQRRLMLACLLRRVLPFARFRLISVDLILRTPKTMKDRVGAVLKKLLFARVDRFVLYFKELNGYERFYGIGPDRTTYVPFKVNGWELITARPRGTAGGDYVLCAGRTLRDIRTFVEAMRHTSCPGVLLQQRGELLDAHGTSSWSGDLPPNVKLIIDDSDRLEGFIDRISAARLVVIPRFKNDIAPTGISTYLLAMALNKCVIISEGPGANEVLHDQAVIVRAEEAEKLADQIRRLWNNDKLRRVVAARGYEYAMSLGNEARLLSDIVRASVEGLAASATVLQIPISDSAA